MRKLAMGLVLMAMVGTAAAGDRFADANYADGNDYSARVFYSLDFGKGHSQSVGLRFDNVQAAAYGAPALFKASFDGRGTLPTLSLQGVDVAGPAIAANQSETAGWFGSLSIGQIVGIAFTALVFTGIVVEAGNNDEPAPAGSGTGS